MRQMPLTDLTKSIMDKYKVRLLPKALRDLDSIYAYIAIEKHSPANAKEQMDRIKNAVLSLDTFPHSHQLCQTGRFADWGY